MLYRVRSVVKGHGKVLKALVVFGSSVYNPTRSRDLDLLIVVDSLSNVKEKQLLEHEVSRSLKSAGLRKPVDIVVLDVEALKENANPGSVVSGLVLGYKVVHDEIGVPGIVRKILCDISKEEGYTVFKSGKKLNLHALAKARKSSCYEV